MIIKFLIILLLVLVVLSLARALYCLLVDRQEASKKRTLYALGFRVTVAAALLCLTFYAFYSGKIAPTAPWEYQQKGIN